jgi:hypothetical protein
MAVVAGAHFGIRSVPITIVESASGRIDCSAPEYPNALAAYSRRVLPALRRIAAGARKGS